MIMGFIIVGTAKDEIEVIELTKIVNIAQLGMRIRKLDKEGV